jgi:hypothetical protein
MRVFRHSAQYAGNMTVDWKSKKTSAYAAAIVITVAFVAMFASYRSDCELRGCFNPSGDGKTYLIIDDNNGGDCGPIKVDGKVWSYSTGKAGQIKPGVHTIECGSEISFKIPPNVVYRFNYWGP